ncbi:LysR family transcriptional regulator [Achromobacter aloeverae]|uniref:LysR family transcriptional regulator n=1 Tax=Achromobacter aloeverae TaxID=1750518 RepID=A0A4V1MSE4_9BURK|nr:LysR family transcriptional regulator [Achromobacter aloeverae]RXN91289.1 LysR family transcriptional regulator [Achromobacter aloeverae]
MQFPDLNLLYALDILLEEGSVTAAARRMNLSTPAMSRTLARIRETVGDPILVKAGRGLAPTPRAEALRDEVRDAVERSRQLLCQRTAIDPRTLERSFNLRASDFYTGAFGQALIERVQTEAPRVSLRFSPDNDSTEPVLRDGTVDIYITSMRPLGPDMHVQTLFSTRIVGVAREGHPIFSGDITPARVAEFDHIAVSRMGRAHGPIDAALDALGLSRRVAVIVPHAMGGLLMLGGTDLIVAAPEHMATAARRQGLRVRTFPLPLPLDPLVLVQGWHPRYQNYAAHRWLRTLVREICETLAATAP